MSDSTLTAQPKSEGEKVMDDNRSFTVPPKTEIALIVCLHVLEEIDFDLPPEEEKSVENCITELRRFVYDIINKSIDAAEAHAREGLIR